MKDVVMLSLESTDITTLRSTIETTFDELFDIAKGLLKKNVPGMEENPQAVLKMVEQLNLERQYMQAYMGGPFVPDKDESSIMPC
jgi:hypothetical protein